MSVPGFSVSDLIQALYHAKLVYDAFFDEYSNSASEVRDLAEEIDQFRKNLVQHQETFDARGVKVSGYEGMKRTLEGCQRFLVNYKELLDSKRKRSLVASFKTVKFAYDDEIKRLRDQIQRHYFNIFFTQLNTAVLVAKFAYLQNCSCANSLQEGFTAQQRGYHRPSCSITAIAYPRLIKINITALHTSVTWKPFPPV
jgi:hypothetical protein